MAHPPANQTIALDPYILEALMPDLVGHDQRPSSFIVYLALWRMADPLASQPAPGVRISHAWVMWRNEGRWWLLDCTLRSAPIAADTLPENRYIPLYSFSKGSTYRHAATQVGIAQVASKKKAPVASNGRRS